MKKTCARQNPKHQASASPVFVLFLLNISLQLFDGLATYQGILLGWKEGNPLLQSLMAYWGVGWALLFFKVKACLLLVFLRSLPHPLLVSVALAFTAAAYFLLSFVPWLSHYLLLFLASP